MLARCLKSVANDLIDDAQENLKQAKWHKIINKICILSLGAEAEALSGYIVTTRI